MKSLTELCVLFSWFAGIVLSSNWYAVLATVFPPYGIYVFVARLLKMWSII